MLCSLRFRRKIAETDCRTDGLDAGQKNVDAGQKLLAVLGLALAAHLGDVEGAAMYEMLVGDNAAANLVNAAQRALPAPRRFGQGVQG